MAKQSRPQQWNAACADARKALEEMQSYYEDFQDAMNSLQELQSEYQEWYDNMPEGLQDGPTGEKLTTITEFDFEVEVDLDQANEIVEEAENAELPVGFGRD